MSSKLCFICFIDKFVFLENGAKMSEVVSKKNWLEKKHFFENKIITDLKKYSNRAEHIKKCKQLF
jgi:hypothetical protein